eukprot:TRINITY_DN833_c0_g2_i2.p1 TRINITY_DN833_c0_g2~~TRINITY_DN833_c0_g2_i2.p1  ORF type:complete len:472 (-),score=38.80 TRINITY_DN833_c0_g2_i2:751-2166(-)
MFTFCKSVVVVLQIFQSTLGQGCNEVQEWEQSQQGLPDYRSLLHGVCNAGTGIDELIEQGGEKSEITIAEAAIATLCNGTNLSYYVHSICPLEVIEVQESHISGFAFLPAYNMTILTRSLGAKGDPYSLHITFNFNTYSAEVYIRSFDYTLEDAAYSSSSMNTSQILQNAFNNFGALNKSMDDSLLPLEEIFTLDGDALPKYIGEVPVNESLVDDIEEQQDKTDFQLPITEDTIQFNERRQAIENTNAYTPYIESEQDGAIQVFISLATFQPLSETVEITVPENELVSSLYKEEYDLDDNDEYFDGGIQQGYDTDNDGSETTQFEPVMENQVTLLSDSEQDISQPVENKVGMDRGKNISASALVKNRSAVVVYPNPIISPEIEQSIAQQEVDINVTYLQSKEQLQAPYNEQESKQQKENIDSIQDKNISQNQTQIYSTSIYEDQYQSNINLSFFVGNLSTFQVQVTSDDGL